MTPIMEASDELWHYPMVQYIADHWSLPVQEPGVETAWRQEGSQPPLYYLTGALLTWWIDTSDLPDVRRINPHADNGVIRQDGNTNLIVHTDRERMAWGGATLAIHIIRLASVAMGAGTVYLTYRLCRAVWPSEGWLALAAGGLTASNPMFCFVSGSVNNDNLAMLLGAAGIWLIVRLVARHSGDVPQGRPVWRQDVAVLGIVLGLAVLTKSSTAALLPLTALAVSFIAWRRRSWWHWLSGGVVTAGLVIAIAGWWFARNAILYDGDWTGIDRFMVILGYRDPPATLRQLWDERRGFMMAYWGLFGGVNVPMPDWIYHVLNGSVVAALAGLLLTVARRFWDRVVRGHTPRQPGSARAVEAALLVLWPAAVALLWVSWALRTWSSQGRLVFTAISAWSTWHAVGLGRLVPRRWSALAPGLLAVGMLGVAAWAPWGVIAPAYRPPVVPEGAAISPQHPLLADIGGQVRLLGYDLESSSVRPGEHLYFTLYWQAQRPMDRDWSVFCHLLDLETGLPIATRDRYPGQGLLSTSDMPAGLHWADRYALGVPTTAHAPRSALLEVGLYDLETGERPPIAIEGNDGAAVVDNALRFQPVQVVPREGAYPNPLNVSFEDRIRLVGWEIDRLVARPGDTLNLVLYWECVREMDEDLTVFAQIVDDRDQKWAQRDAWPADVATSGWQAGDTFEDPYALTLNGDTPLGGKTLIVGVYRRDEGGGIERLRLINEEGRMLLHTYLALDCIAVQERAQ